MHTVQRKKQNSAKDNESRSIDERRKWKQRQKQNGNIFVILLVVCFLLGVYPAKAEEELKLYASSAVLMDGSSGRILYGKEVAEPLPMASTTKIMTIVQRFREQNTKALEMQCFQGFFLFHGMLNNFCKHLKICPLVTR